jgi:hypothetical protein
MFGESDQTKLAAGYNEYALQPRFQVEAPGEIGERLERETAKISIRTFDLCLRRATVAAEI